jgi:hypothetical protein
MSKSLQICNLVTDQIAMMHGLNKVELLTMFGDALQTQK